MTSMIECKIKLKRTSGEVVDTATSLPASPTVNHAIDAPDGDEMVKAKIMRVKQIADGPPLEFEIIAVEISLKTSFAMSSTRRGDQPLAVLKATT